MMSKFTFLITSYQGFEDEVLRLRNRNRPIVQRAQIVIENKCCPHSVPWGFH